MKKSDSELLLSPAKSLFLGDLEENQIFPFPKIAENEIETLSLVVDAVEKFLAGKDEQFRAYDVKGEQPSEYLDALKELGLFGLIIPEEYGGIGLSNAGYSRVLQQTSRHDASTSLTIGAHSSIGMKGLLLFGSPEQKQKYLPKLASGENIAAFCLTEAGSGSDAASIRTTASKNPDGTWTLNGEKIWITNGGIAGFFTVFARTDSPNGKLSAFIVERSWAGVSTGPKEDKMGIRASITTTVRFDNVIVPPECVLGEEGNGFKIAMSILNNGRTGLGGGCVGGMKRLIASAIQQAKERKQFGRSIAEFQLVRDKIAQASVMCFATESVVSMVANLIDSGHQDYSIEAAISKIYATESLWQVAFEALQIAGGNGFMREFPYERVTRDSRINLIFEGTNEILRLYIALSGFKDAGDYLKDVGKSVSNFFNDPIKGFGVMRSYARGKLSQLTPVGRPTLSKAAAELKFEAQSIERYVAEFSRAAEAALRKHGKNIVGNQLLSKRFADMTIDLFISLCVISRVTSLIAEKGAEAAAPERAMARMFVQQAKRRINQNLRRIDKNEDAEMEAVAKYVIDLGRTPWDIL